MQADAKAAVHSIVPDHEGAVHRGAASTVDPATGAVRAIVGGDDFAAVEVQPGHAGPPAAGLVVQALRPRRRARGRLQPRRHGRRHLAVHLQAAWRTQALRRPRTTKVQRRRRDVDRRATASSVNCAYVRMGLAVGLKQVCRHGQADGHHVADGAKSPSISLGSTEVLATRDGIAYATLANDGIHHTPYFVEKVLDRRGDVLFEGKDEHPPSQLRWPGSPPRSCKESCTGGTGTRARRSRPRRWRARPARRRTTRTPGSSASRHSCRPPCGWAPPTATCRCATSAASAVTGGTYPARIWSTFVERRARGSARAQFALPDPKLIPSGKSVFGADFSATTSTPSSSTLVPPLTMPSIPNFPRPSLPPGVTYPPGNTAPRDPNERPPGWPADWDWP